MTFPSPKTGGPALRAFQIPRDHADLRARRLFCETWAEATFGLGVRWRFVALIARELDIPIDKHVFPRHEWWVTKGRRVELTPPSDGTNAPIKDGVLWPSVVTLYSAMANKFADHFEHAAVELSRTVLLSP
jgi:hypothetical protein